MAGKHQLQIAQKSIKGVNWSNKKVLDIGCSNGSLTCEILKLTKAKEIIGIDSDKERINKAKKLSEKNNKVKFLLLNANNISVFPNESFDAIFSNMTFNQFFDSGIVLKEIYRLLKPKGIAIINFNQERSEVRIEIEKQKAKFLGGSYKLPKKKKVSANKFKKEAQKIGFSQINIKSKKDIYFFESVDGLMGKPKDFNLDDKKYDLLWQKLRRGFEKYKTKKGYKETWNIVFAQLTK